MTTNKNGLTDASVVVGALSGWVVLAIAVLLAAGCSGGGIAQQGTPKPDPDMAQPEEEAQRDRARSREEMAELVKDIEALNQKTEDLWNEYADLEGEAAAAAARYGGASASIQAAFQKMTMDGIRRNLESLNEGLLPGLGPQVAAEYRLANRRHEKAVKKLEAAKRR